MANAIYPKWKEAIMQASANSSLTGTVQAVLIDTASYTYSAAHEFYSSAVAGAVGSSQAIGSKTFVNGVFDGANITFPTVTGATAEAIILFIPTGDNATSRLIAYFDTDVTGLPVTPNGGDIALNFNASGIFAL